MVTTKIVLQINHHKMHVTYKNEILIFWGRFRELHVIDKSCKQYFSCNGFPTYCNEKYRTLQTVQGKEREEYGVVISRVRHNLSILSML